MSSLDKLMQLEGAIGAFEFADNGELGEHRIGEGSVPPSAPRASSRNPGQMHHRPETGKYRRLHQ